MPAVSGIEKKSSSKKCASMLRRHGRQYLHRVRADLGDDREQTVNAVIVAQSNEPPFREGLRCEYLGEHDEARSAKYLRNASRRRIGSGGGGSLNSSRARCREGTVRSRSFAAYHLLRVRNRRRA